MTSWTEIAQRWLGYPWLTPVSFILGGLILGWLVETLVVGQFRRFAKRTRWQADDLVVNAIGTMPVFWFFLAGVYAAAPRMMLPPEYTSLLQQSVRIVFILSLTVLLARISSGLVAVYSARSEGLFPSTSIFRNLTSVLVYVLGGLVVLESLGISITPLLTALGVGGLAVALALQDTLSNLFAGLHIVASRQVQVGDYVKLESGEEGYIVDIRWRNTSIRALPNNMILVPNAKLASSIMTNFYQPDKELPLLLNLGVSYDSDLEKVERVTIEVGREVMKEVQGGVAGFEPFIRYNTFADSSINFTVILRGKEYTDQYLVKHEFIKRLHARYAQEGIQIPFPIRTVYMKGAVA